MSILQNEQQIVDLTYIASPTLRRFHTSTGFVRGIRGPIGSGKSVGCCWELFKLMREQKPGPDGFRRTRWVVIRNTYAELETTTIKTWLDWFPEHIFGKFVKRAPMCHHIQYEDIQAEVWFLAMDRADDVKKLLSLELTGAWVNEAREIVYEVISMLTGRVGRYPSMRMGGPTWFGIIMDTNPPDDDHWWAILEGAAPLPDGWTVPTDWEFFIQPPAMFEVHVDGKIQWEINPEAENLANLPKEYYHNFSQGKTTHYLRVYVGNKFGTTVEGLPVYADEWNEDIHLSKRDLIWIPGLIIHVGLDFGRTPAACFSQQTTRGQWQDIHELVTQGMGAERFAKVLYGECRSVFPDAQFEFWGDPSGGDPGQLDERTYFEILDNAGIRVRPAPAINWTTRREAGARPMTRLLDGQSGYLCSSKCKYLVKGFRGRFRYRKLKTSGINQYDDSKPEKNDVSHVHEGRQYAYCGAGEARNLVRGNRRKQSRKPHRAKIDFNPIGAT